MNLERQVRAAFDSESVTVYQAYTSAIADSAILAGTFVPPFRRERMTWIKPSFLWMMYRSNWATGPGQERILSISIRRSGFEWALAHSTLTSFEPTIYSTSEAWADQLRATPARIQWDPERSLSLDPLPWRTVQIGLAAEAVRRYLDEWILAIKEITPVVREIRARITRGDQQGARSLLPEELPYDLPATLRHRIHAS